MKYRAKPVPTLAIQLNMDITYEKWGGTQQAKAGDWMLQKAGDTFTCEANVFADTYKPLTNDSQYGWYYKVAIVEAVQAEESGRIQTLEGESAYEAGDYIVTNPAGEQYPIGESKFEELYEPA